MKVEFVDSIEKIKKQDWENVQITKYPFLKYQFLESLESSKCVSPEQGWSPFHIVVSDQEIIVAIMPLYIKTDSQGEFIFDWSWADAYYRNGLDYYPKLVSSIPFTPATGPRILINNRVKRADVIRKISNRLKQISEDNNFSSVHVLLAQKDEIDKFSTEDFSLRTSYSFHWFNNKYQNFNHFLDDMTSRQRKNIKKERNKIEAQGVTMMRVKGDEIKQEMIETFYQFYQVTYLKRGMRGYLNFKFFENIIKSIPESIVLVLAKNSSNQYVAGALNFYDDEKLYGRYWGCLEEYDSLHFETCYYQGIEFCIEQNLSSFDPGVQGEHKIKRGFCPIETYSAHWIKDIRFKDAINDFLTREREHILEYNENRRSLLPFKIEVTKELYERI